MRMPMSKGVFHLLGVFIIIGQMFFTPFVSFFFQFFYLGLEFGTALHCCFHEWGQHLKIALT